MKDVLQKLDEATHADWAGGAPAVEVGFARQLAEEVLRLQSLARYEPLIRGSLINDILGHLGMALSKDSYNSVEEGILRFKDIHADIPQAWLDVIDERRRQMEKLGFTHQQDDGYVYAELPRAALCYIRTAMGHPNIDPPMEWPWSLQHWKPRSPREDLVRAVALGIAEIERLDRQPEQAR